MDFWRYWNPVYGYVLYYYCYRPLRRFLPRPWACLLTFLLRGFVLYDLVGCAISQHRHYPQMTVFFGIAGAGAVASEILGADLADHPTAVGAACNLAYLTTRWELASLIASRTA